MKRKYISFSLITFVLTFGMFLIVGCSPEGEDNDNCVTVIEGVWQVHFQEVTFGDEFDRSLTANQDSCELSFSQEYGMSLKGEIVNDRWIGNGSDSISTWTMDIQFNNDPAESFSGLYTLSLFTGTTSNGTVEGSISQ